MLCIVFMFLNKRKMLVRTVDNTQRGKFHTLEIRSGGGDSPLTYDDKKLPITLLDTYNFLVNQTQVLIKDTDGKFYDVLHANSELSVSLDEASTGKVLKGKPAVVGDNMNKKASPAPLCYVDSTGAINSVVASDVIWSETVMGWNAEGKPDTYAQGFVRQGSSNHEGLFLRKDGTWGSPSLYTGSVSEHFTSLNDTPPSYEGNLDKYLRVSYAEGGSVVFDDIDTSKVAENINLYYTEERVESKIAQKAADRSLTSLSVINTITAKDFLCDSDRRLKRDVSPLDPVSALQAVMKLRPVSYTFVGDATKERIGFISQEVNQVFPHLVDDTGDFQKLNYLDIIGHLVASIQQLQLEIQSMKFHLDLI